MTALERFHAAYGEGDCYAHPEPDLIASYEGRLPEGLLEEWRLRGWCSFAGGLIWTVNPNDYIGVVAEWLPDWHESADETLVFARSAFGDLLVSHDGATGQLNVHYGRYVNMHLHAAWFMDKSLTKPSYLKEAFDGALAKKAMKKLGPLAADEMFAFEPALALGGAHELKYVKKVKMMPQLSILVQLYDSISIE